MLARPKGCEQSEHVGFPKMGRFTTHAQSLKDCGCKRTLKGCFALRGASGAKTEVHFA
jgi:hypothetical protein